MQECTSFSQVCTSQF